MADERGPERIVNPEDAVRRGTKRPGAEEQPAAEVSSKQDGGVTDEQSNAGTPTGGDTTLTPQRGED